MGKPMGAGLPLAGVVARDELVDAFRKKTRYFNTFASSPLQAAVGMAVLDVIEDDDVRSNVNSVGNYLRAALDQLQTDYEPMGDVRSHGLSIAIDWVTDRESKAPDTEGVNRVINRLKEKGFLMGSGGSLRNALKIRPPLIFSRENADAFLTAFRETLKEFYGSA
jgi:4-aminobutyrate aminotransferase-like enzyme